MARTKRTDCDGKKVHDGKQYKAQNNRSDEIGVFPHKRTKIELKGNCSKCGGHIEKDKFSNMTIHTCVECGHLFETMTEDQEKIQKQEEKFYWDTILDDPYEIDDDYECKEYTDDDYELDVEKELEYIHDLHDMGGI